MPATSALNHRQKQYGNGAVEGADETADQLLTDGAERMVLQSKDAASKLYNNCTDAKAIEINASGHDCSEDSAQFQQKTI